MLFARPKTNHKVFKNSEVEVARTKGANFFISEFLSCLVIFAYINQVAFSIFSFFKIKHIFNIK